MKQLKKNSLGFVESLDDFKKMFKIKDIGCKKEIRLQVDGRIEKPECELKIMWNITKWNEKREPVVTVWAWSNCWESNIFFTSKSIFTSLDEVLRIMYLIDYNLQNFKNQDTGIARKCHDFVTG